MRIDLTLSVRRPARSGWRLQINRVTGMIFRAKGLVRMLYFRPSLDPCKVDLPPERKVVSRL